MPLLAELSTLLPLITGVTGVASGVRFVQESQRGVKLRFGKVIRAAGGRPRIANPGFLFLIPGVHSLRRIHVRTTTLALAPQSIMLADHTVFNVGALIIVRIVDTPEGVYASLFEVDDVNKSIEEYCASVLRDVLTQTAHAELANPHKLATMIHEKVAPRLTSWGVEIQEFALTDCSPSPETARMILIGTEAEFRAEALITAASKLGVDERKLDPTVAAALIGTPVSVALGVHHRAIPNGHPIAEDEEE